MVSTDPGWVGVGVRGIGPTRKAGFALPVVLSVLVMLGLMGAAALQSSRDELLSALAVSRSNQAFYAAEAGIHSAIQDWDMTAMDTLVANPGDSLVASWTQIANRCAYRVVYRRIDGGDAGRKLYSLESTGRTPGLDGATQRIGAIVVGPSIVTAAVALGGNLEISANAKILGPCGAIRANGNLAVGGDPTIAVDLSASGTATVNGNPVDTFGNPITATEGVEAIEIPELDSTDYCGEAEFIFDSSGGGLKVSTSESFDFTSGGVHWGWKWNSASNIYISDSEFLEEGVYCVDGNVEIVHDVGVAGNPHAISILATKSVQISSNPYIASAHSDSILVMAEGDLKLNGNPSGGNESFTGLVYAGAQCEISGTAKLYGQLVCRDGSNPSGSEEWANESKISGEAEIGYGCGGFEVGIPAEPIPGRMWTHVW